uniref:PhoD-like phosphatase metallophosphatase domain-containing protein n=1 Tax=Odontella aurita TaxID=265563 RepID=A0A7S4HVT3_9STRA|mmetsp:Transcript_16022/g.46082  ORF Transcript_16022/g.46082 Transcript_16022/m.46082 type:complete len:530 (+) Transcript_16022:162-1751(+)
MAPSAASLLAAAASFAFLLSPASLSSASESLSSAVAPEGTAAAADADAVDVEYPHLTISKIAFGSCHSSKRSDNDPSAADIWKSIAAEEPDAFLWTGDAVYARSKGDAPPSDLAAEYDRMRADADLGYAPFLERAELPGGVHGTWDDHDYGGNDRGVEARDKIPRRDAYLDFLGVPPDDPRRSRPGVYSSVTYGRSPRKVKVIFLDTRWGRDRHCIPSVGAAKHLPLGAVAACATRWMTAGLDLHSVLPPCRRGGRRRRRRRSMLDEEQWEWLGAQLRYSDAAVHVVISSVQVLTTNPVVESWGHFPEERARLLGVLNGARGAVLLSGDVHHSEVLDAGAAVAVAPSSSGEERRRGILEVTSSGLTHSCVEPFYGGVCAPILDAFSAHRFRGDDSGGGGENGRGGGARSFDGKFYYTGRNYGTVRLDWGRDGWRGTAPDGAETASPEASVVVDVRDRDGNVVLSTGSLNLSRSTALTEAELSGVAPCIDGHLLPLVRRVGMTLALLCILALGWTRRSRRVSVDEAKKTE